MIRLARRVGQRRPDVIRLEIRKIAQDFFVRDTFCEHSEHVGHADPQPPDAWSAAALIGVYRDAFEKVHISHSALPLAGNQSSLWDFILRHRLGAPRLPSLTLGAART